MKYLLLIYSEERPEDAGPPSPEEMKPWLDYTQEMIDAGVHISGEPLQGSDTATTVRLRDGDTLITDGPFAETKEVLGGFYMIEAGTLDDALEWARKCPAAEYGSVEVRPLAIMPDGVDA